MTSANKTHIVSIDDDDALLKLVTAILDKTYRVTTFSDAQVALNKIRELEPDLIICDIDMPSLSGFELHEALRAGTTRFVPFIFLTGLKDRQTFRKGMVQGADDYLTKPFSADELRTAVETRLARARTLRENDEAQNVLQITSLGGADVSYNGKVLHYEAKKVIELLLYLLVHDAPVNLRGTLSELWRNKVKDNNIHVLLGRARKTYQNLAKFIVEGEQLRLELATSAEWDAATFKQAAKNALQNRDYLELEHTASLYTGSFLPGFDSPWSESQRAHYDALYLDVLEANLSAAPDSVTRERARVRLKTFLGED